MKRRVVVVNAMLKNSTQISLFLHEVDTVVIYWPTAQSMQFFRRLQCSQGQVAY